MNTASRVVVSLFLGCLLCLTGASGADREAKDKVDEWRTEYERGTEGTKKILHDLEQLLASPDERVELKIKAAQLVARMGWGRGAGFSSRVLYPLLKDANPKMREEAANALGTLGDPEAVPVLIPLLKDEHVMARYRAAESLGFIGVRAKLAVPALVEALQDKDPLVIRSVCDALGKMGPSAHEAIPALIARAKLPEDNWAIHTLGRIGPVGPNGQKALDFLREELKHPDPRERGAAALALGAMAPEQVDVIPALLSVYEAKDVKDPKQVKLLQQAVIGALGGIGPAGARANPAVVPFLIKVLKEPGDDVLRASAVGALESIGPEAKAAIPTLKEVAGGRKAGMLRDAARDAIPWIEK